MAATSKPTTASVVLQTRMDLRDLAALKNYYAKLGIYPQSRAELIRMALGDFCILLQTTKQWYPPEDYLDAVKTLGTIVPKSALRKSSNVVKTLTAALVEKTNKQLGVQTEQEVTPTGEELFPVVGDEEAATKTLDELLSQENEDEA